MPASSSVSDRLRDTLDAIDGAGLGLVGWPAAIARLRDLTDSRVAQISGVTGVKPSTAAPLNWTTEDNDWHELVGAGGLDIGINSRRRVSLSAPILSVRDEASFYTVADCAKHPAYGDFLKRWDYPYVCLTPVARRPDMTITLSVTRGSRQGGLTAEGKHLLTKAGRRVRQAIRTQEVLQARSLERVVAAFDQLSQAVFACDGGGRILTLTPAAEQLLAAGDRLRGIAGRLTTCTRKEASWLSAAIARGCAKGDGPLEPRLVHNAEGGRPLLLDITPLPAVANDFWGPAAVLVIARELDGAHAASRLARLGVVAMGFTPAEEAVARELLAGQSPSETAQHLGIAVGTVRVHVRNIYAKTGVHNQLAFAALMGTLR